MANELQPTRKLTWVNDRLCVALVLNGQCLRVLEREMCCSMWIRGKGDKLGIDVDGDVDLYDPQDKNEAIKEIITVAKYRDRFLQKIAAMIEQVDGDRFWFTSVDLANRFMAIHGMTEVPGEFMDKLRKDASKKDAGEEDIGPLGHIENLTCLVSKSSTITMQDDGIHDLGPQSSAPQFQGDVITVWIESIDEP